MKKISSKAVSVTALAVIFALASTQVPASGQNGLGSRIEGTWRVQLTFRDCQTGAAGPTVPALNTFLDGGSMIATPSASPALVRTGHGVWRHAGGRNFMNTLVFSAITRRMALLPGLRSDTKH
jgi:hypothetical protein